VTNEEKELREIREAAGEDAGCSHENLLILVRNAVPQIPHALELMQELAGVKRERDALRGEVVALREELEVSLGLVGMIQDGLDVEGSAEELYTGINAALATPAGKPEAEVIAAVVKVAEAEEDYKVKRQAWIRSDVDCYTGSRAKDRMDTADEKLSVARRILCKAVKRMKDARS